MDRRKFLIVAGAGAAAVAAGYLILTNMGGPTAPTRKTLYLYTWEEEMNFDPPIEYQGTEYDNVSDLFPQVYPGYEVEASYYGDQDRMIADLIAGRRADVIAPCVDTIPTLVEEDLIAEIDTTLLENWSKMFPIFRDITGVKVGGKVVFIPTNYGSEAISYRTDLFEDNGLEPPTSWYDFFHPWELGFDNLDDKRRILMPDDSYLGVAMAALSLGYNLDANGDGLWELTDEQLENCKEVLINQKPYVRKYSEEPDVEMPSLLSGGDVYMSIGWAPETLVLNDEGFPVEFVIPDEGPLVFLCGNAIVANTENYEDAHKLLDFYLGPIIQKYFATEYWYGITNEAVVNLLKEEDPDLVDSLLLDKPQEALSKGSFEYPLAEGQDELWEAVWDEVLEA